MDTGLFSALIISCDTQTREQVVETLTRFGEGALRFAAESGIRINALGKRDRYADASASLRRLNIDVDAWPSPPAGLFVVEERTVYLRSRSAMTVAHEFGHGLDCALGGGIYHSSVDPQIRSAFTNAKAFVTPYAATGLDEYFAENVRAYVECNDTQSFWPKATRARLRTIDPEAYALIHRIFASFAPR